MNVAGNEMLVCMEADRELFSHSEFDSDPWRVLGVPLTFARLFERLYELALKGCSIFSSNYLRSFSCEKLNCLVFSTKIQG